MGRFSKLRLMMKEKTTKKKKGEEDASESMVGRPSTPLSPSCGPSQTSAVMITTQSSGQVVLPALSPEKAFSASPGRSTSPSVFGGPPFQSSESFDPWARAYEILQAREPELMGDYRQHLASLQCQTGAGMDHLTPRSVESIVKQLWNERDKKRWQVSLLGKDVKIRQQVERMAKFLLWTEPVVKTATSTQPYAALAWSGVSLLLPLLTTGTLINEAMLKGFNSIGDVQFYWELFEEEYLRPSHQQRYQTLREPLAKLYSHIIEYQARAICHLTKAQLSRAWENVAGWNDWDGKATDISNMSKQCSEYIAPLEAAEIWKNRDSQLREMQESRTILDEIRMGLEAGRKQTQTYYEDQTERQLLQDLASDYEDHKNFNPPRIQGTCEWFFTDNRFHRWRNSNTSSLLWVSAGPGCGKSVLSRALIDEGRLSMNVTTSTTCYFFFKDGDERRMHATDALAAILHQLFTNDPASGLIRHALPSHKNHGKNLTQNFSELWRILVDCASSPGAGDIICVIDALDECNADDRRKFIDRLKEFYCQPCHPSDQPLNLKFLITSRPYDDLEASFNRLSDTTAYLCFDGDEKSSQISNEINLVIDARLSEITRDFEEDDRRTISEQLKRMEHRTYLWVHLTFNIIEQSPSEYGKRSDLETLLSDLPSEVSEAYEKILDQSKNQIQTETLLQIVLAAAQPLTLDEANIALTLALQKQPSTSYTDLKSKLWPKKVFERTVKSLCGLFISVYDSRISFIHQTAKEFLIHPEREGKWKGRFTLSKAHSKMALVCLKYLSYPDGKRPGDEIAAEYPLAQYSAQYLMDHARPAKTESNIHEFIGNFLLQHDRAYDVWVALFSLDLGQVTYERHYNPEDHAPPLYEASLAGLQHTVELFLEKGVNLNAQGGLYGNALQAASYNGNKEIVQLLLNAGAVVNVQGGHCGTALQAASHNDNKEIVQLLLDVDADVNVEGGYYGTALQIACYNSNKNIVQLLLDVGADVNAQGGYYGTALQIACYNGNKDIVQLLLDVGADVNLHGGHYHTALQAASMHDQKEVVQLLLDMGADVNVDGGYYGTALQIASGQGYKKIVQLLLDVGADVNVQGGHYGTALQAASYNGNKDIVQLLLNVGADMNAQDGHYGTALQAAYYIGNKEIVQLLLDMGADVNVESEYYGTALQIASAHGDKETVQLLLDVGADVNVQCGRYDTALQAASHNGNKEIVQLLLDVGASVNMQGGLYGTALQAAYYNGNKDIVQLLLDMGADVNVQGGRYGTALQAACYNDNKEIVQLLLDVGADVNAQGGDNGTALQIACFNGNKDIVQLLLNVGADVNEGGDDGTALQIGSYHGNKDIVQLLLDVGADVNVQGGHYGTALQAASHSGNKEIVQLLLDVGVDPNVQGGNYGTALQAASYTGKKEIVQLLLDVGADVNAQGGKYGNALQAASMWNDKDVVQLLLDNGANVNAQDGYYGTVLQAACYNGNKEIVQLLLDVGADVNVQGGEYGNALQAASQEGHIEVVQLLLQRGADNTLDIEGPQT